MTDINRCVKHQGVRKSTTASLPGNPPSSIMMPILGSASICDVTTVASFNQGAFYWLLLSFGIWWR